MPSSTQMLQLEPEVALHAIITTPSCSSSKPTLVFLHYYGGSSKTWLKVIERLCDDYRTVALDFRGWGGSSGPATDDAYSIKHLASDVEEVTKMLNLDNYILIGLSMGAKVAQLIAAQNPPGLLSIILVSPASLAPFQLPPEMRQEQIHAFDSADSAKFVSQNVLTGSGVPKEVVDALVSDQLRGNEWARAAWPAYAMAEDYGELAERIKVPALVLAADRDIVEKPERVRKEVHDQIQRAEWGMISDSGHLSPVEKPDEIAQAIQLFISSHE